MKSIKPGNIHLDCDQAFRVVAASILTLAGSAQFPWLVPLAVLLVWREVENLATLDIDEEHAAVVWALWQLKGSNDHVRKDSLLVGVNEQVAPFGHMSLTQQRVDTLLLDLAEMGCIVDEGDTWLLREQLVARYA